MNPTEETRGKFRTAKQNPQWDRWVINASSHGAGGFSVLLWEAMALGGNSQDINGRRSAFCLGVTTAVLAGPEPLLLSQRWKRGSLLLLLGQQFAPQMRRTPLSTLSARSYSARSVAITFFPLNLSWEFFPRYIIFSLPPGKKWNGYGLSCSC